MCLKKQLLIDNAMESGAEYLSSVIYLNSGAVLATVSVLTTRARYMS